MTAPDVDPIATLIDEFADAVWAGDGSSDAARAALVAAISRLRALIAAARQTPPPGRGTLSP